MSNSYNDNDPRLRQDKLERKDKENSSAGMIAGVIIILIGLIGIYLYYQYGSPVTTPVVNTQPAAVVAPATTTTTTTTVPATTNSQ